MAAKLLTKNELMIQYKAMYGEKALESALYFGYTKRDYTIAIETYKDLEKSWGDEKYERLKHGRTQPEREILRKLNNFI